MRGFENFDLRSWASSGVTKHFSSTSSSKKMSRKPRDSRRSAALLMAAVSHVVLTCAPVNAASESAIRIPVKKSIQVSSSIVSNPPDFVRIKEVGGLESLGEAVAGLDAEWFSLVSMVSGPEPLSVSEDLLLLADKVSKMDFSNDSIDVWAKNLAPTVLGS